MATKRSETAPRTPQLLLIIIFLLACACSNKPVPIVVSVKGTPLTLQLALNNEDRRLGLGNLETIPSLGGMLFVYANPRELHYAMVNCLFDIDIVYLDSNGAIIALHEMKMESPKLPSETEAQYLARLPRYSSGQAAQFVIEMHAGMIRKLKLVTGDTINFPWAELAAQAD